MTFNMCIYIFGLMWWKMCTTEMVNTKYDSNPDRGLYFTITGCMVNTKVLPAKYCLTWKVLLKIIFC